MYFLSFALMSIFENSVEFRYIPVTMFGSTTVDTQDTALTLRDATGVDRSSYVTFSGGITCYEPGCIATRSRAANGFRSWWM